MLGHQREPTAAWTAGPLSPCDGTSPISEEPGYVDLARSAIALRDVTPVTAVPYGTPVWDGPGDVSSEPDLVPAVASGRSGYGTPVILVGSTFEPSFSWSANDL